MKIRISFFVFPVFSLEQEDQDIVRQIRSFRESVPFR